MNENNIALNITEILIMLGISSATLVINPPLPLLAIPFLLIITSRTIFFSLEDSGNKWFWFFNSTIDS